MKDEMTNSDYYGAVEALNLWRSNQGLNINQAAVVMCTFLTFYFASSDGYEHNQIKEIRNELTDRFWDVIKDRMAAIELADRFLDVLASRTKQGKE